jgi:hypothetical protein
MIISLIVIAFLSYIIWNTKIDGDKLAPWIGGWIAVIALTSPLAALAEVGLIATFIYKGVQSGEIDTLDWIENLIK